MSELNLMFIGDIMLGELLENINRGVKSKIKKGIDPFEHIKNILFKSDLVIGNLECVLSDNSCLPKPYSLTLRADPEYAKLLFENNIKLVNLANNHIKDHGDKATISTINALNEYKIQHFGQSINYDFQTTPKILHLKNTKLGFLGYNLANKTYDELNELKDKIIENIKKFKKEIDILILSLHWGLEYVNIPSRPYTSFAKDFLNAGADIIHGHHSHQLQGVTTNDNKIIAFSLGNFIFDDLRKKNRFTGVLEVKVDSLEKKIKSQKLYPAYINRNFQPIPIYNEKKKLQYIEKLNHIANTSYYASEAASRLIKTTALKNSRNGHLKNRIRIRFRILLNFWIYYKYMRILTTNRRSPQ